MKFIKFSFIISVFVLIMSLSVSAEEIAVQNNLAGVSQQSVKFDTPVNKGLYYISFDMYAEDTSADVYCRLLGNDGSFTNPSNPYLFDAAAFKNWCSKPVFTVFGDMYCDWQMQVPASSKKEYKAKEWYEVDIWLDFSKKISTVYLNGEYFDTSKMNADFKSFYGFAFYCDVTYVKDDKTKTFFKYKNLCYGQISNNYIQEDIENVHIPQYLKDPVDISIVTNKDGNIYFTPENIALVVGMKNKTAENKSYNVDYEVLSEGIPVWKSSETVTINSGRSSSKRLRINLNDADVQYGFFDFNVILTDLSTNEVTKKETRFSVAKKSEKVNNKVGLNQHYSKRIYEKGMEVGAELFRAAGFGADRDGLVWTNYEVPKGEYHLADKLNTWLDTAKENNVTTVAILGYHNDIYKELYPNGETVAPPVDGEYMEKWKLYVENMVRDTIDRVGYYEVWNEWNLSYNNNGKEHYTYHPAEDYVKLVEVTYEIVDRINKEKGTNAKVLAGALGYNSGDGTDDFIRECIELGICDYCDGISCHPYWAHENPEDNNYYSTLIAVRTIREELDSRNIKDIEIVATELGYPTRENGNIGEMEQAKWMVRSSAYYEGEIDLITWYVGQEKIDNNETENSFGIIKPWTGTEIPYEAKPAYIALANYNSLLAGAELISRSPEIDDRYADGSYINNEQYTYHFRNDGKDIYMLVTMSRSGAVLKLETGKAGIAELVDMYGNSCLISSDDKGVYMVSVENDEPVYIIPVAQSITKNEGGEVLSVYGYSDGYVIKKESDDYVTLNKASNSYTVSTEAPITGGIVDISYRFRPNMVSYNDVSKQVTQTFELGEGFSFNAQWTSWGGAYWVKDGKFNIGSHTVIMNKDGWNTGGTAGLFRAQDQNADAPIAYYDISAKINLDTKKIYITIVEYLETKTVSKEPAIILNNAEFDYNADVFDCYRTSLSDTDECLQSLNSSLTIQADKDVSGAKTVKEAMYTYSDGYIFTAEGEEDTILEDEEIGYFNIDSEKYIDLTDTPVNEGIVDVSFRFQPNLYWGSEFYKSAKQTFEFGDGFKFDANWTTFGGSAAWLVNCHFNIGVYTKTMNSSRWNLGDYPAGYVRGYNIHGTADWNEKSPYAYYDISAKINLDTKKIYITIVEHLRITSDIKTAKIMDNMEFDYNSNVFDYFRTSITAEDPYLHSLNSNLLIKADGAASYRSGEAKLSDNSKVIVKSGDDEIDTFAELSRSSANVAFNNVTENGIEAVLVIAYYKNGIMVKIDEIKNIQINGGYENVRYKYNFERAGIDADSVKVFVWDSITGITPVKEAAWLR